MFIVRSKNWWRLENETSLRSTPSEAGKYWRMLLSGLRSACEYERIRIPESGSTRNHWSACTRVLSISTYFIEQIVCMSGYTKHICLHICTEYARENICEFIWLVHVCIRICVHDYDIRIYTYIHTHNVNSVGCSNYVWEYLQIN